MPAVAADPVPRPATAVQSQQSSITSIPLTSFTSNPSASSLPGPPLSPHSVSLLLLLRYWITATADAAANHDGGGERGREDGSTRAEQLTQLGMLLWKEMKGGEGCREKSRAELETTLRAELGVEDEEEKAMGDESRLAEDAVQWWTDQLSSLTSPDALDDVFTALPSLLVSYSAIHNEHQPDNAIVKAMVRSSATQSTTHSTEHDRHSPGLASSPA
jgi:hypothetical protein